MKNGQKYSERLKCELTAQEISEAAKSLAQANQRLSRLEDEKKQVDSQLKADMSVCEAEINRLSGWICTGSEFREVECIWMLDYPETDKKTLIRKDTGEEVRTVAMTDEDRQMSLDLMTRAEEEAKAREDAENLSKPPLPQLEAGDPQTTHGETFTVTPVASNGDGKPLRRECFTIGAENEIIFHPAGSPMPGVGLAQIRSTDDLAAFLEPWTGSQIQALYDGIPNAEPVNLVKKGRAKATERIWESIQSLRA